MQVFKVLLFGGRKHEDIVQISRRVFADVVTEHRGHDLGEMRGRGAETLWASFEHECLVVEVEPTERLAVFVEGYLKIPLFEVERAENDRLTFGNGVYDRLHAGN